ncbi:MAG TPA: MCP four helix bundle domain-containing protein [Bacteroidales bacterium]
MKLSIRTKFTLGMSFLFIIILVLSVFSGFYINKLSKKTSAILKENFLSVVYAREMSERIANINIEIFDSFLTNKTPDSLKIYTELGYFDKSLQDEKNNLTEPGEDKLVSVIEADFKDYSKSVKNSLGLPHSSEKILSMQNFSAGLLEQLVLLSEMNGKALEIKTDDAKESSKSALTRMTILATLCFLIGMSFTFSFASYFNQRFFLLYSGIKEIISGNFRKRLLLDGKDEFYELSLIFNDMIDKLNENNRQISVTLTEDRREDINEKDIDELKLMLFRIKSMEEQAAALISRIEKK